MAEPFVRSDVQDGVGIVRLVRPPANAIEIASAKQLANRIEALERDNDVQAIVLTGTGGFFSAGLDLKLVPAYGRTEQQHMIRELGRAVLGIYGSRKPTVAAVNGHAVAAGTLFTLCCDYRIGVAGNTRYGLTGARVGIPYPIAALEVIQTELGHAGSRAVLLGAMTFDASSAVNLGILDEITADERVLARALEVAKDRALMPAKMYGELKRKLRAAPLVRIRDSIESDPALDGWISDDE